MKMICKNWLSVIDDRNSVNAMRLISFIMSEQIEEEIAVSGSLFSVSLFEEKLMKNFLLISNKLRKLEGAL